MTHSPLPKSDILWTAWVLLSRIGRGLNDSRLIGLTALLLVGCYVARPDDPQSTFKYLNLLIVDFDLAGLMAFALFISGALMILSTSDRFWLSFLLTVPIQLYIFTDISNMLSGNIPLSTTAFNLLPLIIIYRRIIKLLYREILDAQNIIQSPSSTQSSGRQ